MYRVPPARAWRPAVVARLAQTLGIRMRSFWLPRQEVRREASRTKQPRAVWLCGIFCKAHRRRVQGMSRAAVMAELFNLLSFIVSATRAAALAMQTGFVSQFFGPAAVGSIAASLVFPSGGRQVSGAPSLVSAEREHPQGVNRINPCGGTVHTFASPASLMPNLSFKRSANGMSRWSSSAGPSAHFALAVQRAMPLSPA